MRRAQLNRLAEQACATEWEAQTRLRNVNQARNRAALVVQTAYRIYASRLSAEARMDRARSMGTRMKVMRSSLHATHSTATSLYIILHQSTSVYISVHHSTQKCMPVHATHSTHYITLHYITLHHAT